jgi:Flp pilus assembly protein TadG
MSMRVSFSKFIQDIRGVAAIEFGLLMPLFFLMFVGLVDLTGYITLARKATNAAAVVGDLAAQEPSTTSTTRLNDYFDSLGMIFYDRDQDVRVVVENYRMNGTTPELEWSWTNNLGPACPGTPPGAQLTKLMGANNDVIVSRVCLNYQPFFSFLEGTFDIQEVSMVRPRSTTQLECTTCTQG